VQLKAITHNLMILKRQPRPFLQSISDTVISTAPVRTREAQGSYSYRSVIELVVDVSV
jgi:hypothetical protein